MGRERGSGGYGSVLPCSGFCWNLGALCFSARFSLVGRQWCGFLASGLHSNVLVGVSFCTVEDLRIPLVFEDIILKQRAHFSYEGVESETLGSSGRLQQHRRSPSFSLSRHLAGRRFQVWRWLQEALGFWARNSTAAQCNRAPSGGKKKREVMGKLKEGKAGAR